MADNEQDMQEAEAAEAGTAEAGTAEAVDADAGASEVEPTAPEGRGRRVRKTRVGVVTSDRSQKTVTVSVERTFAHPLYGKRVARTKKYHAHDENDEYEIGDVVRIVETRPLSRTKRWRVVELIERPA